MIDNITEMISFIKSVKCRNSSTAKLQKEILDEPEISYENSRHPIYGKISIFYCTDECRIIKSFNEDLNKGLLLEANIPARKKKKYLELMSNKSIKQRMKNDGVKNSHNAADIFNLCNKPESETRNGLILHNVWNIINNNY